MDADFVGRYELARGVRRDTTLGEQYGAEDARERALKAEDHGALDEIQELVHTLIPQAINDAVDRLIATAPPFEGATQLTVPVVTGYKRGWLGKPIPLLGEQQMHCWVLLSLDTFSVLTENKEIMRCDADHASSLQRINLFDEHVRTLRELYEELNAFGA